MWDKRFLALMLALVAVLIFSSSAFAQEGWIWFDQSQVKQKQKSESRRRAPLRVHDLTGMWACWAWSSSGLFAGPAPNDGKPQHQCPIRLTDWKFTSLTRRSKALTQLTPGKRTIQGNSAILSGCRT